MAVRRRCRQRWEGEEQRRGPKAGKENGERRRAGHRPKPEFPETDITWSASNAGILLRASQCARDMVEKTSEKTGGTEAKHGLEQYCMLLDATQAPSVTTSAK